MQDRLINASCYEPDSVDNNLEITRKRNKENESIVEPLNVCSYCRHKFATDDQGPGTPKLTKGCKRNAKIGTREYSVFLRKWRKDDSHSDLKDAKVVGIEENYGCISCCCCDVCKEQFKIIDALIYIKKPKHAPAKLPIGDLNDNSNAYVNNLDNYDIADEGIGASQVEYENAIYGSSKGSHILLQLLHGILYSLPRVYVTINNANNDFNDNENDDDVIEITTHWPEIRSSLQFPSNPTDRYVLIIYFFIYDLTIDISFIF